MFRIKNKIYSDAGYILVSDKKIGYQFEGNESDFSERKIDLNNIDFRDNYIILDGIVMLSASTYADLKRDMVHRRYTNDDQLAIMLNRDSDEFSYNKMQEWRQFSGEVASAIINKKQELYEN